ncbi:MAG: phosphotransferase [Oscillospiraceae bacterium]|nr:phosphotransferase [Oscillospiraceae bacterium]
MGSNENIIAERQTKTVYREGDKCIKGFGSGFTKSDVLNEALSQSRVEETGLRIPKILDVTEINGQWSIVSEFIEGKTLSALMKEFPEKREEHINLLTDLQIEVHSKNNNMLIKLRDKLHREICSSEIEATTRFDLHARLEGMPKHDKICHGDFCPSNIIITEDGTPYIVDWSQVSQGNASGDAAWSYLTIYMSWGEEAAERYLELFCEKGGIDKRYVQRWMPIIAAARLSLEKPEEHDFLFKWANVV